MPSRRLALMIPPLYRRILLSVKERLRKTVIFYSMLFLARAVQILFEDYKSVTNVQLVKTIRLSFYLVFGLNAYLQSLEYLKDIDHCNSNSTPWFSTKHHEFKSNNLLLLLTLQTRKKYSVLTVT